MSKNIEDLFKESLREHSFPYDEKAWVSLEKRLPQSTISYAKWLKWGVGAAILVSGITVATLMSTSEESKTVAQQKTSINKQPATEQKSKQNTERNSKNAISSTDNKPEISSGTKNIEAESTKKTTATNYSATVETNHIESANNHVLPTEWKQDYKSKEDLPVNPMDLTFPEIPEKCTGESITLNNKNNRTIYLKEPNGIFIAIEPSERIKFYLKEPGQYGFVSDIKGKIQQSFHVRSGESFELILDRELNYENGLPTIKASTDTKESNVQWIVNGRFQDLKGKQVQLNMFDKGRFEVVAKVQSNDGCIAEKSTNVLVKEDYNLLAVNAFDPYSSNVLNRGFLPYALKVRQTPFKMTIMDPESSAVVFETSDFTQEWDGIDKRNGKMVPANKSYIWKVVLIQPEKGEKNTYTGTIVRM
jgi:hypothetical protein